jgi:hypothetical protein
MASPLVNVVVVPLSAVRVLSPTAETNPASVTLMGTVLLSEAMPESISSDEQPHNIIIAVASIIVIFVVIFISLLLFYLISAGESLA